MARNIDALLRGLAARGDATEPLVEFVDVPPCRVSSQRVLCAFGLLMGRVAAAAQEKTLDAKSEAFVPDVSRTLRALFAHFRKELGERGLGNVNRLLTDAASCRDVLRKLAAVPALVSRCSTGGAGGEVSSFLPEAGGSVASKGRVGQLCPLRVATWNIAGGQRSAQAPETYSALDQRAAVVGEILRWCRVFGCDVVELQECESAEVYSEMLGTHEFVGSREAVANRGFVHLYLRRGLAFERLELEEDCPCVAATVTFDNEGSFAKSVDVAAVHLPTGDGRGRRQRILEQVGAKCSEDKMLIVRDMNVKDDAEVKALCKELDVQEARYAGVS